MENYGPGLHRRYLGRRLRLLRGRQSPTAVARAAGISQPHLSRVEGGRCAITTDITARVLTACGAPREAHTELVALAEQAGQPGWWEQFADLISDNFATFVSLEADAGRVEAYESAYVPGQLQIAQYAQELRRSSAPHASEATLKRSVDLRLARQSHRSGDLQVVIDEAVVRRLVGDTGVMRDQVAVLRDHALKGYLQVILFEAGPHPGMRGAFTCLRFPTLQGMDLAYATTAWRGRYYEKEEDLNRFSENFSRLREIALTPDESASFLDTLWR